MHAMRYSQEPHDDIEAEKLNQNGGLQQDGQFAGDYTDVQDSTRYEGDGEGRPPTPPVSGRSVLTECVAQNSTK